MFLENSTPNISEPFSPQVVKKLQALEKKRKLSENKLFLWLTVPVLWAIPMLLSYFFRSNGYVIFSVIWIFIVLFGMGIYIHVVLPSNEEISNQYKKAIISDLLRISGAEGDYALRHSLKVEPFLKSGLYHENYSHFERADSIVGKFKGVKFGLYELAVQVASTLKMPGVLAQSSLLTNNFYGWVLHVPIRTLAGNTFIIPANKKMKGESDDWIKPTFEYFAKSNAVTVFKTGNVNFDSAFYVYTTNASESEKILTLKFQEFLLLVLSQAANAPGFSFVENRAYMHLAISDSAFDRQFRQKIYPPDTDLVFQKIRFFNAMALALHSAAAF